MLLIDCEVQEAIEAFEQCAHMLHRYSQAYDLSKEYTPTVIEYDDKYAKRHEAGTLSENSRAKLANMTSKHHTRLQKGERATGHKQDKTNGIPMEDNSKGHFVAHHSNFKPKAQLTTTEEEEKLMNSELTVEDGPPKDVHSIVESGDEVTLAGSGIVPDDEALLSENPHDLDFNAINAAILENGIAHLHKIIFKNHTPTTSYISNISAKARSLSTKVSGAGQTTSTKFTRIGENDGEEEEGEIETSSTRQLSASGKFRTSRKSTKGLSKSTGSSTNKVSTKGGSSSAHHWFMTLTFEDYDGNIIHPMQRSCTKDNQGEATIFGEKGDYMDIQIHANKQQFIKNHVSIEVFEHKTMRDVSFGKCQISLQSFLMNLEHEQELVPSPIEILNEKQKVVGNLQIFGNITPKKELDLSFYSLDNGERTLICMNSCLIFRTFFIHTTSLFIDSLT